MTNHPKFGYPETAIPVGANAEGKGSPGGKPPVSEAKTWTLLARGGGSGRTVEPLDPVTCDALPELVFLG